MQPFRSFQSTTLEQHILDDEKAHTALRRCFEEMGSELMGEIAKVVKKHEEYRFALEPYIDSRIQTKFSERLKPVVVHGWTNSAVIFLLLMYVIFQHLGYVR